MAAAAAPGIFDAATAAEDAALKRIWRLQVQALTVAPMELLDCRQSDAAMESLRRLRHPYLGCLLPDQPFFDEMSDRLELNGASKVLGLSDPHHSKLFSPFPKLSELERSILHAEAFGEKSRGSNPVSIPFILSIPQAVCKLRYMPPSKKTIRLEIPSPPSQYRDYTSSDDMPVFVQKITLVKDKDKGSFFEVETNSYRFDRSVVGSEKIACQNDLVIFSRQQTDAPNGPRGPVQSFSADSATFCLNRTYSLSSVIEQIGGVTAKTVMQIHIPDNPPACDYSLLGNVFNVESILPVEEKDEIKDQENPKSKIAASESNMVIKIHGEQPVIPMNCECFALFFVPPEHSNNPYVEALKSNHSFQLGWLYKIQPGFQIEPWFRTTEALNPYIANAVCEGKEEDPLHAYNFGYKQLMKLKPQLLGQLKVVLIPGRIVVMPLYFKPESLFSQRSGSQRELQVSPDKECFAIVAGVKPGVVFHSSIVSQIKNFRDTLIKHFRSFGLASHDVAIDPLAVFSFCSNKITDPSICTMLLSCCEDISAVLGCRKKSKKKQDGLLYTHPDQINTLWKLYGVGLAVEAFNRLAHSSKSFSRALRNISQQEVIDLALKIHFVERLGSIFEIQQRVILQCFDVMEVHNRPQVSEDPEKFPEDVVPFSENQAESLLTFLACVKREVFEPGLDDKDTRSMQECIPFRMPQNISRIIRKLLCTTPPFHKAKYCQLINEVVFMASSSLSLISRFIKQLTFYRHNDIEDISKLAKDKYQKRLQQFFLLHTNSIDYKAYVKTSCCIFHECDRTAFYIQDHTASCIQDGSKSPQQTTDPVVYNPYFLQMSMTVLVAAMVDFVSPLRYHSIYDRAFSADKHNPAFHALDQAQVRAAEQFKFRIECLQEVKMQCDRLRHISTRKNPSEVSSRRACYFGIVDLALHVCWYSMCQPGEERCKYNIPIPFNQVLQSHLPFETYFPLRREDPVEYEETSKIVERWSSGLLFLNKVMLPSLFICSDPSSKAVRVCAVSSICNFLRTSASLDASLFKFLFIRDLVADHRHIGKVSACHLLLEASAACIELEPDVSLSVHNKSLYIEDEEELDDEENLWFPYRLLYQNFRAPVECDSDFFGMSRLSSTFRLMRSLCSLSLLSAATQIQDPMSDDVHSPTMYGNVFERLERWLNEMNNMPFEKCPVKLSFQSDDDEDSQFFSNPYYLICYMMICKESIQLDKMAEFQHDFAVADLENDFHSNHFVKVSSKVRELHMNPKPKLVNAFEVCHAQDFSSQFFNQIFFDFEENEDFKQEFTNSDLNHERMVSNWIDFLSAYVELNSKKLSCRCVDVSVIEDFDEMVGIMDCLKDILSVEDNPDEKQFHNRIFNHMSTLFKQDPDMHDRWVKMMDHRPPSKASDLTLTRQAKNPHPLDLSLSDDSPIGGISCLGICVSFWMFPYTTTSMKASLVRYLRCYLEGAHNFYKHSTGHMSAQMTNQKFKNLEKVKELAAQKCQSLFRMVMVVPNDPSELFVILAMKRDFDRREWTHTIELLKLLRVMLVFEVEDFAYIHHIIDFLWSRLKNISFSDDQNQHIMFQLFEVFNCFASILADLCESFDPSDYFLSQQKQMANSGFCLFRYAILRQVCSSQSNREPLCCLFLRVLSLISRHTHYTQLMPAALSASRLLLVAHERQKELGILRASDKNIFRPFEEDSLDSFEAIMISNLAVPFLFCAAGHMEIRTFPALSLFMSFLHPYNNNRDYNPCSHRILLEFPNQLCCWASSSTLLSLSNSVLLLSSSMLLLSKILEDAARTIPNSSHGILLQIMPSSEIHPSYRCGPALGCVDQTLSFVVETLLEQDGYGFFNFHSHLMARTVENPENDFDHFHLSTPLIHQWIFSPSGNALSKLSRRLSKFLTCQSLVHRNILIGDFFCQFAFDKAPLNVFGTFHPFQLQVFDQQECYDTIFQKLMDVGSERSFECVQGNFSSGANTLVNFIALLRALTCVSVNSICDILRTCPSKTESSHHAPSLAHILLNQHAMYSHSIVDERSFHFFDDYHVSRLLFSLLTQVKGFFTVPNETQRFDNLNHRYVWMLPILSRSWEILAILLEGPFSRLICAHVIQIFRLPGESWLWGCRGELGQLDIGEDAAEYRSRQCTDADARHTSLSALIDCTSFLNYFLKMNSNLNPSKGFKEVTDLYGVDMQYKHLSALHDLLSHGMHAISWSVKALKSMIWIVNTLCPEQFSYDFRGLVDIWNWAEGRQFWNRMFVGNFLNEPQDPHDGDDSTMSSNDERPVDHTLISSIRHVVESRSNFMVEQQLFELLLRCQNNEFDSVSLEMRHGIPDWFSDRLKEWNVFEDRIMLSDVLSAALDSPIDLSKEWDQVQTKATLLNILLLSRQGSNLQWMDSVHDPFKIIDRSRLELVHRHSDPASGSSSPNQDEAFKSLSLHALHFNHALSLKSSKCHLAQSLGSLFSVIFGVRDSFQFDLATIYHQRDDVSTCVIFIDFALRLSLFLRDWLVTHVQANFTLRFLKAARTAIIRLKGLSDVAKESFLQQHRSLFLKISENICQIIISKSSNVNQAAALERQELYMLLLEYLSAFDCNHSGYRGSDFVLHDLLCCDEQRYLPLAFYTILQDIADANTTQSIEAMMLLARLFLLVPATTAIVNVVASSASFSSQLMLYVDGPLSQPPLLSWIFHTRCLLLCRVVQRNPSLVAPTVVAMRESPFFVEKGSFFSVISSQQNSQRNVAQFADQVIAFHLVADSVMSIIFRCAFALDTLLSFSASEGLLELLHFLHFCFYQYRAGDSSQIENWLLRLLRHFSGSRDPYLEYLTRKQACLPAPFMRPFSSFATALYGQVSAAVLSLAVLQRHRVRTWSAAVPWLSIFHVADKEIPQILVNISLLDMSVAGVDVLELPRGKLSQEDIEYDGMMATYQMRLDILLYASVYCRHLPAESQIVNGRPFFQYTANFDPGLKLALNNLQLSQPSHGAAIAHVRHLFEICYKLTWSIKNSYDSDYPIRQSENLQWQPRADVGLRNKFRSTMLCIVENLCDCVIQLVLAHIHMRGDPLVSDPESGYIAIALDIIKRAKICAEECAPSACDSLLALQLQLLRVKFQE